MTRKSRTPVLFFGNFRSGESQTRGIRGTSTPHFWSVVGGCGGGPQFPARFQGKGQSKAPWGPRVVKRTPQLERGGLDSNIIFTYADFISTPSLIVLRFRNKCQPPVVRLPQQAQLVARTFQPPGSALSGPPPSQLIATTQNFSGTLGFGLRSFVALRKITGIFRIPPLTRGIQRCSVWGNPKTIKTILCRVDAIQRYLRRGNRRTGAGFSCRPAIQGNGFDGGCVFLPQKIHEDKLPASC
jgi:hypothetical protein